jgi:hypothetical protein
MSIVIIVIVVLVLIIAVGASMYNGLVKLNQQASQAPL